MNRMVQREFDARLRGRTLKNQAKESARPFNDTVAFRKVFGIALVAAWIAFFPSLSGPFIFDDFGLPFTQAHWETMPAAAWIGRVRPLLMASYWLNLELAGQSPFAFHAVNVTLHALAASLVFLSSMSLLGKAGVAAGKRRVFAILIAGLFLLHPLQTEAVAYIAGRSEVLTSVFFFAAFALFLRTPRPEIGYARALAILALSGAAVLSKEHAVILPVLLVFTGFFWKEGSAVEHVRKYAKLYAPLALLGALTAIAVLRLLATASTAGFHVEGLSWSQYFLTECRVVPVYLGLFVFPVSQNADWMFPFSYSLLDKGAVFYLIALVAGAVLAFYYRRRTPLLVYGFAVFVLLLAPTSSFVPIKDALAERRMYLPIVGLAIATAALLASSRVSQKALLVTVCAVLTVEGAATWSRSEIWGNDVALWLDVVHKSPENIRGFKSLGLALVKHNRCGDAVLAYARAHALATVQQPDLELALASALVCNHQPDKARAVLLQLAPSEESAVTFSEMGVAAAKAGNEPQASSDFNEAILRAPNYAPAYAYRGLLELATDNTRAEQDFSRALQLDPNNRFALDGMRQLGK
jgi:hypothetical protein